MLRMILNFIFIKKNYGQKDLILKHRFLKTAKMTTEISVYAQIVEDKYKCVIMCPIFYVLTMAGQVSFLV